MIFQDFQREHTERINQGLKAVLGAQQIHSKRLADAMSYVINAPGKRLRPLLCYATGLAVDAPVGCLDKVAAAIELVHTYSLVHDDLPAMDDDDLRRGRPTCHVEFDEATAILVGDALQALAFETLAGVENKAHLGSLVVELAKAAGGCGMVDGQMLDMQAESKDIDLAQLALLHQKKTGALIHASVKMACLCGQAEMAGSSNALSEFARLLGLAFQIKDDILDVESDSDTLGKPQGSDAQRQKSTYPRLLGLDGAKNRLTETYQQALDVLCSVPGDTRMLQEIAQLVIERKH